MSKKYYPDQKESFRRIIVISLMFMVIATVTWAMNSDRIEVLKSEARELMTLKQQYSEQLRRIEIRLIEINAIIGELQKQDTEETKPNEDGQS